MLCWHFRLRRFLATEPTSNAGLFHLTRQSTNVKVSSILENHHETSLFPIKEARSSKSPVTSIRREEDDGETRHNAMREELLDRHPFGEDRLYLSQRHVSRAHLPAGAADATVKLFI